MVVESQYLRYSRRLYIIFSIRYATAAKFCVMPDISSSIEVLLEGLVLTCSNAHTEGAPLIDRDTSFSWPSCVAFCTQGSEVGQR